MTLPRSTLVDPGTTPYYHCISRCVRRAFLCGVDSTSGRTFEHRRGWIVARLAELSQVFAIDVCAYAIMSNHHHLVLKLDPRVAAAWDEDDVLERWCALFLGPMLVQRLRAGERLSGAERRRVSEWVETYRQRLCDLSWFMRCLNEPIARWANAEDECTGRFWEGRFKSQALLDEQALLSCMAYVDLNPIRAGMAETPEASDFTSLQQRIQGHSRPSAQADDQEPEALEKAIPKLLRFAGNDHDDSGLPFALADYLELVDWSGRAIHPAKRGRIPDDTPPILHHLGIRPDRLLRYLGRKERGFYLLIGAPNSFRQAADSLGRRFFKGISAASRLFPEPLG